MSLSQQKSRMKRVFIKEISLKYSPKKIYACSAACFPTAQLTFYNSSNPTIRGAVNGPNYFEWIEAMKVFIERPLGKNVI